MWSSLAMLASLVVSLVAGWHAAVIALIMSFGTIGFVFVTAWLAETKRHQHESAEHESDEEARALDERERTV